jgi:tetratricopeptide (TPR) repeat protein
VGDPSRLPSSADIRQAAALHQQGRLAEAEQLYAAMLAADPRQFDALHLLGLLKHQQGLSADALSNYGMVLDALKRHEEALAVFDRALALRTDHANALNNRGLALAALGRIEEALASWTKALAVDASHFAALHSLGDALHDLDRHHEAVAAYRMALAVRPDHVGILNNCGGSLEALERFDQAIECYDRALALDPRLTELHINKGNALAALGEFTPALASYADAAIIEPGRAEIDWCASLIRLRSGRFAEGWRGYETRWRKASWADQRRDFPQPLWRGDAPIEGKTVLLHAEQGLGDTLQFVRYAPLVARRGASVILEVQPPLKTLLATIEGTGGIVSRGEPLPAFDLHCPMMSLPLAFGTELATIPADVPYLRAPAERLASWRDRLGDRRALQVGVAWAGSAAHKNNRNRSIALDRFGSLLSVPGITFVSLQKERRAEETAWLRSKPQVVDFGDRLGDFADTATLISLLDVVVCVDTAVAHLAGALGKPVWILLPFACDFRWLIAREDSPWYPTARLFRQPAIGDWESVLARVDHELRCLVH